MYSFILVFIYSSIFSFMYFFIHLFLCLLILKLFYLFFFLFIYSFIHSFIHSLIYLFIMYIYLLHYLHFYPYLLICLLISIYLHSSKLSHSTATLYSLLHRHRFPPSFQYPLFYFLILFPLRIQYSLLLILNTFSYLLPILLSPTCSYKV